MNPQDGEGSNNKPPITPTASIAKPDVGVSSNPSNPSNPLAGLEDVVNAARQAAAVQAVTAPAQAPGETPKTQFENQFGEAEPPVEPTPATPPSSSEPTPDLMGQALSNLETLQQTQPQPVVETPAEKLKQEIANRVDAFLEEVTKEKAAA